MEHLGFQPVEGHPVTSNAHVSRRLVLQAGAVGAALGAPGLLMAQPRSVKIGLLHPVSGALAYPGSQSRLGGQWAIDEINAAGGIKSMGGIKLEAVLGDSQSRPEVGVSEVERMQEEGVSCYVGCYSSAIALPATQAAAKYGTPFMIDVGVSDTLVNRGLKNIFRLAPGNGKCVDDAFAGLGDINKRAGGVAKTAVLVHEDSEFGTTTAKLLAGKLASIGITVKETLKHATPTRDFSNLVLRIKSIKPDLVIMSNYLNEYVLLARTLYQQKVELEGVFTVLGGGFNYKFVKEMPEVAEYTMDFNHWYNPRNPKAQDMRRRVEAKGGQFSFELYCAYNAVKCYADAVERAKTSNKEAVTAALEASTWSDHFMPYGPTKFVNGQNLGGRAVLLQATKTGIDVVWPDEFASTKPVFPRPRLS
jgi:branched-chain amino acid transport system substrate-binding protein